MSEGDGMAEVTEGDREKAMRVLGCEWALNSETREQVEIVATALADEREKARAPFLALAEEFDQRRAVYANAATGSHDDGINKAYWVAADRIRRAAEGTL